MANQTTDNQKLQRGFVGDQLETGLREYIRTSKVHMPIASERALSREYGISYGTVRKVVQQLVDEKLLYKVHGRGVFVGETPESVEVRDDATILLLDDWGMGDHPYSLRRLRGVLDVADELGWRVETRTWRTGDAEEMDRLYREAMRPEISGIIVTLVTPSFTKRLRDARPDLPLVTVGTTDTALSVAGVHHNQMSIGSMAATYLCESGASVIQAIAKRREVIPGMRLALEEFTDPPTLEPVIYKSDDTVESIRDLILGRRPDALFFSDDRFAKAVLESIQHQDPAFLSSVHVVSCANVGEEFLPPWVAQLKVDGYDSGKFAMALIRESVENETVVSTSLKIEPQLVPPTATYSAPKSS